MKKCPKCGADVNAADVKCPVCGYSFVEANTSVAPAQGGLIERVKNILIKPQAEWEVIAKEEPNVAKITMGYLVPLALVTAIATALGIGLIGMNFGFFRYTSWSLGITSGIISFIISIATCYLSALIIDMLAPSFDSQKNFGRAFQTIVYSMTPFWIAGILNIIPTLGILAFLGGLYGIYIMYLGLPLTMKTSNKDKVIIYLVVSILAFVVVYFIISLILGAILTSIFFSGFGGLGRF